MRPLGQPREHSGRAFDDAMHRVLLHVEFHADAARQVTLLAQERLGPLAGGMGDLGLPGL